MTSVTIDLMAQDPNAVEFVLFAARADLALANGHGVGSGEAMNSVRPHFDALSPDERTLASKLADRLESIWNQNVTTMRASHVLVSEMLELLGASIEEGEGRCCICGTWWRFSRLIYGDFPLHEILMPHVCPECIEGMAALAMHGRLGRQASIRRVWRSVEARRAESGYVNSADAFTSTRFQWRLRPGSDPRGGRG